MTNSIKKRLLTITKSIGYSIWFLLYGKIKSVIDSSNHNSIDILKAFVEKDYSYKIFSIRNCRIYTDTVTDTAFIINNQIIDGPSFQHRNPKNADVSENIVFQKGTPKLKKRLKGKTFSLLTGGGGNANYWHWLFDVLPRLKILEQKINLSDIDFFLLPDLNEKFQLETLDLLNIPDKKRVSSKIFRHIQTDHAYAVDHPYVLQNNASDGILNLPMWILDFLREKFLGKKNENKFPRKFYSDRSDSKSNHRHLRKILNEEEVKNFLKKRGFSILTLSDLSFIDQTKLFYNASEIVGLHGAGFANLVFCKPGTKILELKSDTAGSVCGNLAKKVNLTHEDLSVEPSKHSNNNQQGIITIPLNLLEKK